MDKDILRFDRFYPDDDEASDVADDSSEVSIRPRGNLIEEDEKGKGKGKGKEKENKGKGKEKEPNDHPKGSQDLLLIERMNVPQENPEPHRGSAPDQPATFDSLPDEIVNQIFGYLSERDLGKTAQVSRNWRRLSYDIPLWKDKAKAWHLLPPSDTQPNDPDVTKSFYVDRFISFKRREKEEERRLEREEQARRATRERERLIDRVATVETVLKWSLVNRFWDYLSFFAIVLGTIFVVLKLDGKVSWSWAVVFIPFVVPLIQLILTPLTFDVLNWYFDGEINHRLRGGAARSSQEHAVGHVLTAITAYRPLVYVGIICVTVFLVLFWVKIGGHVTSIPWWALLIPALVALIAYIQAPIFGDCRHISSVWSAYDRRLDRWCLALPGCTLLITVIFLAIKLGNYVSWDWAIVFTPIWLMFFLCILVPLLFWCSCCCRDSCLGNSTLGNEGGASCICFVSLWILVFGPFLTFIVLLLQNLRTIDDNEKNDNPTDDNKTRRYALVFIPIFIFEGFACCACMFADIAIWIDAFN